MVKNKNELAVLSLSSPRLLPNHFQKCFFALLCSTRGNNPILSVFWPFLSDWITIILYILSPKKRWLHSHIQPYVKKKKKTTTLRRWWPAMSLWLCTLSSTRSPMPREQQWASWHRLKIKTFFVTGGGKRFNNSSKAQKKKKCVWEFIYLLKSVTN